MRARRAWRRPVGRIVVCLAAALLVAGCGSGIQQSLGLGKRAPDEFQIVRRQPLIMPPSFELPRPTPGVAGAQERSTAAQAREVLTGAGTGGFETGQSSGELALVQDARVTADPDIRRKILEENTELVDLDESRFLMIFDWQRRRMADRAQGGQTLDPVAEAARLRGEGAAVTGPLTVRTGSTPLAAPPPGS